MAVEAKKRSHDESTHSKKRSTSGADGNAEAGPSKTKAKSGPRALPSFTSTLRADEGDFPRGGGTGLTAFELKQVREEGRREADAELAAEVCPLACPSRSSEGALMSGRTARDPPRSPNAS